MAGRRALGPPVRYRSYPEPTLVGEARIKKSEDELTKYAAWVKEQERLGKIKPRNGQPAGSAWEQPHGTGDPGRDAAPVDGPPGAA